MLVPITEDIVPIKAAGSHLPKDPCCTVMQTAWRDSQSKDSGGIVLQDASLNVWERPRAYSNRYESWDNNHLQVSCRSSSPCSVAFEPRKLVADSLSSFVKCEVIRSHLILLNVTCTLHVTKIWILTIVFNYIQGKKCQVPVPNGVSMTHVRHVADLRDYYYHTSG